jgi:hypothetical protein
MSGHLNSFCKVTNFDGDCRRRLGGAPNKKERPARALTLALTTHDSFCPSNLSNSHTASRVFHGIISLICISQPFKHFDALQFLART